ncbi:MAG: MFS transporter [Rhodospirillales bacterium]
MRRRGGPGFFGWRVAWAACAVAFFGWGLGFYGPPVYLHEVVASRGWPVALVSAAVTCHFLVSAAVIALLPGLHRRLGLAATTRAGAVAAAVGVVGWAVAAAPWQLFAATVLSGAGWGATGAAALNAIVTPWFHRRRPAALALAYNGASGGGLAFTPLWVALIAALGFAGAAVATGAATILIVWWVAGRYLRATPAGLDLAPDGAPPASAQDAAAAPADPAPALPGRALYRDRTFRTLALAAALGLVAQVGTLAHLFSVLAAALGEAGAGAATAFATGCAIGGRMLFAALLRPGIDRRIAAAANYAVQMAGCILMALSGGTDVALLLTGVVVFGACIGNATAMPPLVAQAEFAAADLARAVALATAVSQAAYAFAPALFGALRQATQGGPADPAAIFAAAATLQLAAAAVILAGRRRPA